MPTKQIDATETLIKIHSENLNAWFLAHFPHFEEATYEIISLSVHVHVPINVQMAETVFMKLCLYIQAPKPITAVQFINHFHQ
jgi:hypothetical protein